MYVNDIIDTLIEPVLIDDINLFPYTGHRSTNTNYRAILLKLYQYCIRVSDDDQEPDLRWTDYEELKHLRTSQLDDDLRWPVSELKRLAVAGKRIPVSLMAKNTRAFFSMIEEGPRGTDSTILLRLLKRLQYHWRHYLINSVKVDPSTTEITNLSGAWYWLVKDENDKLVLGKTLTKGEASLWQVYTMKFEVLSYLVLNFHNLTPEDQFVLTPVTTVNKSFCRR